MCMAHNVIKMCNVRERKKTVSTGLKQADYFVCVHILIESDPAHTKKLFNVFDVDLVFDA